MNTEKDWSKYKPEAFQYKGSYIFNWFSNMTPCKIMIRSIPYKSVENYYQASKTKNPTLHGSIASIPPFSAKREGRKIRTFPDWDNIKYNVMKEGLLAKFTQNKDQTKLLINTKDDILIEWNNWNDKEWGVSITDNLGKNMLGICLMEVREIIKNLQIN